MQKAFSTDCSIRQKLSIDNSEHCVDKKNGKVRKSKAVFLLFCVCPATLRLSAVTGYTVQRCEFPGSFSPLVMSGMKDGSIWRFVLSQSSIVTFWICSVVIVSCDSLQSSVVRIS